VLSFFSSRRNWTHSTPHPQASVPPPTVMGRGAHSLAREGLGESQFRRLEKKPTRGHTLWYSYYIRTLWGRVLDPNEKWKKDNGFVAGKVGKYLLFVNCPQGEMGLEGGVNKGRKLHTFLKSGCPETATEYCNFPANFHLSSIRARWPVTVDKV
jgi:hypothetical protein